MEISIENTGSSLTSVQLFRYQYSNHLSTASLELDESADIISYEEYYPFGSTSFQCGRSVAEVSLKRYRYSGKEKDNETGLYYHGARYYAPWLARWTQVDPSEEELSPQSSYCYVNNNPIMLEDLDGMKGKKHQNEHMYFDKKGRLKWKSYSKKEIEDAERERNMNKPQKKKSKKEPPVEKGKKKRKKDKQNNKAYKKREAEKEKEKDKNKNESAGYSYGSTGSNSNSSSEKESNGGGGGDIPPPKKSFWQRLGDNIKKIGKKIVEKINNIFESIKKWLMKGNKIVESMQGNATQKVGIVVNGENTAGGPKPATKLAAKAWVIGQFDFRAWNEIMGTIAIASMEPHNEVNLPGENTSVMIDYYKDIKEANKEAKERERGFDVPDLIDRGMRKGQMDSLYGIGAYNYVNEIDSTNRKKSGGVLVE